jgi:hypothetical protein
LVLFNASMGCHNSYHLSKEPEGNSIRKCCHNSYHLSKQPEGNSIRKFSHQRDDTGIGIPTGPLNVQCVWPTEHKSKPLEKFRIQSAHTMPLGPSLHHFSCCGIQMHIQVELCVPDGMVASLLYKAAFPIKLLS